MTFWGHLGEILLLGATTPTRTHDVTIGSFQWVAVHSRTPLIFHHHRRYIQRRLLHFLSACLLWGPEYPTVEVLGTLLSQSVPADFAPNSAVSHPPGPQTHSLPVFPLYFFHLLPVSPPSREVFSSFLRLFIRFGFLLSSSSLSRWFLFRLRICAADAPRKTPCCRAAISFWGRSISRRWRCFRNRPVGNSDILFRLTNIDINVAFTQTDLPA